MCKTVYLTALMRERTRVPWSIVKDIIKLKMMKIYKTIDLNILIMNIETAYFTFIAKYTNHAYKYLNSLRV